ncbi:hypothetical protein AB1Y20_000408 [Prymnesium parvum]|uniref:Uncharacterized protein n=1 Tax=Prymnesium parvum TaxID=97485 RepID=A0AB34K589_PRYPA|mmetsp:Transcript_1836/g.3815  ORF Transcript_1836/g.3815 Transcript_1836/m.3815 type:complete len:111 (+) Transcript_1836:319-651(+)
MKDGSVKTWEQGPLKVSRVMQVFRTMTVNERLLRDEASAVFLQRKHVKVSTTGYASVAQAADAYVKEQPGDNNISLRSRDAKENPWNMPELVVVPVCCSADAVVQHVVRL